MIDTEVIQSNKKYEAKSACCFHGFCMFLICFVLFCGFLFPLKSATSAPLRRSVGCALGALGTGPGRGFFLRLLKGGDGFNSCNFVQWMYRSRSRPVRLDHVYIYIHHQQLIQSWCEERTSDDGRARGALGCSRFYFIRMMIHMLWLPSQNCQCLWLCFVGWDSNQ